MKKNPYDAKSIFHDGEKLRRSVLELQRTVFTFYRLKHVDKIPDVMPSSVVLLSLALELYLHCLHVVRDTGYKNSRHNLGQWFYHLPETDKEALQANYLERLKFDYGNGEKREKYRKHFREDFGQDINKVSAIHNWSRFIYQYDHDEVLIMSNPLGQMVEAVRSVILTMHPDWELYKIAPWMVAPPAK